MQTESIFSLILLVALLAICNRLARAYDFQLSNNGLIPAYNRRSIELGMLEVSLNVHSTSVRNPALHVAASIFCKSPLTKLTWDKHALYTVLDSFLIFKIQIYNLVFALKCCLFSLCIISPICVLLIIILYCFTYTPQSSF